ncbi:MAG TPA: hypothetical protein VI603_17705 [Saprospiraceae bacterium]|nr:hypothetical protein [Saprospiraceae bacterium]
MNSVRAMQVRHRHGVMKRWFGITLSNLLIAAVIGVLLRFAFIAEIPFFEYKNWLHAHSHLAMLGWVYLALFVLIVEVFIPPDKGTYKKYRRLFWSTQFVVWGMLIAFIARGYWFLSTGFLILHVLLSYLFICKVWIDTSSDGKSRLSTKLLRMSLVFQVISTLALWAVPILIACSLRGTELYYMAIQFFLHFQFNGWFLFCVLALLFRFLEENHIAIPNRASGIFFIFLVLSCFLTYALAVAWSNPLPIVFLINGVGVSVQFLALLFFCFLLYMMRKGIHDTFTGTERLFIYAALACLVLKIFIQTAVVIPDIAKVGYTIRNFVIGFMHLILLGVITMGVFGYAFRKRLLSNGCKPGALLVLAGFLAVELLLFGQGILLWAAMGFMPYYYEAIFGASILIMLGVAWIVVDKLKSAKDLSATGGNV